MSRTSLHLAAVAGAVGLLLSGCQPSTGPGDPLEDLPRSLSAGEREVIAASNSFAFDLLRQVNSDEQDENVFISPLSVSMALGMTMNGAAGETFEEMRSVLGFGGLSDDEINQSYRSLIDLLTGLDRSVETGIANSIWYREGFPFEQTFLDAVQRAFDAKVTGLDFTAPTAIDEVNRWVDRATRGRIDGIIDEIASEDVMFLINAIYFKGDWRNQFPKDRTQPAEFTRLDGSTVRVPMMSNEGEFRYAITDRYRAVDLPYGNGAFTMTIVVPTGAGDVNEMLRGLDEAGWAEILDSLTRAGEIMVALPRFRLEYKKGLVNVLEALGMKAAFMPGGANFTRMSPVGGELYVSEVLHKSFVQVDEEGTEAAAATSVTIRVTSAPPSVRADRPFLFAIRERFSGTILFTGKIVDPLDEGGFD